MIMVFFFQEEDGIRYIGVTGVQTCALPILGSSVKHIVNQRNQESKSKKLKGMLICMSSVVKIYLGMILLSINLDKMGHRDRKSTRLNSSHANISYAVFCLKKKKK